MEFPAHIKSEQKDGVHADRIQTVQEHCLNTARYAGETLSSIGLSHGAYLAGLLHDCGKFKQEFSDYLWKAYRGESVRRGSVNHTFAGCRLILEHFHGEDNWENVTAELIAYAAAAHHGQFDCTDIQGKSGFVFRKEKEGIAYEECVRNYREYCADWAELEEVFQKAHLEMRSIYDKLIAQIQMGGAVAGQQAMFELGQLARLLLSAVIEGDRRDTGEFMNGFCGQKRMEDPCAFWQRYLFTVEEKLSHFPQNTCIEKVRTKFSEICKQKAEEPEGVYRLNLPTGGGKTLSALRYALAHAAKWGKQRIIFVTPLLSILEQNAAVIREFLGNDEIILEHHSGVLNPNSDGKELDMRELAVDSWQSPVIVTTLVQLLDTMFLGKTTSIRRYQAFCDAVVVIDEVQTVPDCMLSLFNTAVNFLSSVCKTTFLLCSATQPCFEAAEHPLRFASRPDVVAYAQELWAPFARTEIRDGGERRLEEIPEFAQKVLMESESLLIICNKKSEAAYLYQNMCVQDGEVFHLSSSMCTAHRRDILRRLEQALEMGKHSGRKTVCVSTQVMEAGVDISFGRVIRLAAGMDSVIQSAGRCNRHGEEKMPAPVYVLQCTNEKLGGLREIQEGKDTTLALLDQYAREPERFEHDLSSKESIDWYYHTLYRKQKSCEGYQQYTVDRDHVLFDLLASNWAAAGKGDHDGYTLNQAFETAGTLFHVLDDSAEDVVVPYGDGAELIRELLSAGASFTVPQLRSWVKRARPYTVSLFEWQKEKIAAGIAPAHGVLILQPEYYDAHTGLITEPESAFLEV